jgi:hypothetical protein
MKIQISSTQQAAEVEGWVLVYDLPNLCLLLVTDVTGSLGDLKASVLVRALADG